MKYYEEAQVPAKIYQRVVRVTCDLCRNEIKEEQFEANEILVKHEVGQRYPDNGSTTTSSFDLCGRCFDHKLIPWLAEQGAQPTITEIDW